MTSKLFYFWLLIWASFSCIGQAGIYIEHALKEKKIFVKEDKRIYVKAKNGQSIKGHFKILDFNHIQIYNTKIPKNEILSIQKYNWYVSFLSSILFVYTGSGMLAFGYLRKVFNNADWIDVSPGIIAGGLVIFQGLKSPRLQRSYKRNKGWTFKFIATPSPPNSVLPNDRN